MSSRGYFILIAALLALLVAALIAFAFIAGTNGLQTWMYAAAQLFLLATAILLTILYRKTVKPMNTLSGGINLIREQDFSTRLRPVGQKDADRIIELFNRMSDQLHNEELRIQEQNNFLDLLIEASPMGVLIMDIDSRISSANPAMNRFLGIQDIGPYGACVLRTAHCPCSNSLRPCSQTRDVSSRPTRSTSTAAPCLPSWTGAFLTLSTWWNL